MADATTPPTKTPWHLWVVGGISLLWNSMGALDFTMTQLRNETYLKACTPEQLAYFSHIPLWAVLTWGLGTWGSFIGSGLLLARCGLAFHLFVASFGGMILTFTYNYLLSDGLKVMGGGAGPLIFSGVIAMIVVLLLVYARVQRKRGVLR